MSKQTSWTPPRAGTTPMDEYRLHINSRYDQHLDDTKQLYQWTIDNPHDFWIDLWSYLSLVPRLPPAITTAYDDSKPMSSNPRFFDGFEMNYAENALFGHSANGNDIALVGLRENTDLATEKRVEKVSWNDLRERVRIAASALKALSVNQGDRVAAVVSNSVWAMVLFLASASIGAIFTSINPDLGAEGCITRLQQIGPSILFCDSTVTFKGKTTDVLAKLDYIIEALTAKPLVFVVPLNSSSGRHATMTDFLNAADISEPLTFNRVSFSYPLVICYSSGTTGAPKCIVHQHGLVLQLKKISTLHNSLGPGDVVLQYSNTSWVVFYIMAGHLATGATCICYDGSPMYPNATRFLQVAEKYHCTYIGTSPRYLLELEIAKAVPKRQFNLSPLRVINTTGAPLAQDQYTWFYNNFPRNVHLSNSAGGTDTATSILASDPSGPLNYGEIQIPALDMAVDILDPTTGSSILHTGQAGEKVVIKPFPSMPCFFWGDDEENSLYKSTYFSRWPARTDVWAQHDWLSRNPETGGYIMHGRSDGVLNPSGIRFGSGEIYAIVEGPRFNSEIAETLCVGRRRKGDRDEEVFLFVKMLPGRVFTDGLRERIKKAVGEGLSPRHVPRFVTGVKDIPVTINGKKVEIAVKKIISGGDVVASSTVANPEVLNDFVRFRELERMPAGSKI